MLKSAFQNKMTKLIYRTVRSILLLFVGAYRTIGTNFFGGACRFEPSCSEYAVNALNEHSPFDATKLIIKRLLKCHPWGPWGYDPVPCNDCSIHKG